MGTFTVPVMVGNPYSAARETVDALVDTGAAFSVMPASLLRRLGIEATRTRRLRLANGEVEERQTGMAFFEVDSMDGEARVVFGPEGLYLLGATTLEDLSFIVWNEDDDVC